jgi:hypothetical protein
LYDLTNGTKGSQILLLLIKREEEVITGFVMQIREKSKLTLTLNIAIKRRREFGFKIQ